MWVISLLLLVIQLKNDGSAFSFPYIEGNLVGNLNFGGCQKNQHGMTCNDIPTLHPNFVRPTNLFLSGTLNSEEWPAFGGCCTALKFMGYPLALSSDSARLELVLLRFKEKHGRVGPTELLLWQVFFCWRFLWWRSWLLTDIFEMFYFQRWRGLARRDAPADWGLWVIFSWGNRSNQPWRSVVCIVRKSALSCEPRNPKSSHPLTMARVFTTPDRHLGTRG